MRPYLEKNPSHKRTGEVAQGLELLPSKSKSLSSNTRAAKKKNPKNKRTAKTVE
jgi:hypothetical protein